MSYLVLARKYRPKTFADVVGQEHVVRPLAGALRTGRVAHAYLFAGARGVGKTTVARLLAMALICEAPDGDRPCGMCQTCQEIIEGQAVDVFEVDGASNRGIDEIRQLRDTVKYLPSRGRYKVYIIDEVHMLTPQAFNALLKTLEEPPEHVVFIFATTEAHKVLPTILSRCQRYDFKRIRLEDLVARLLDIARTEGIQVTPAALRLLARESEGSMRDALSLMDQVIAYCGLEIKDENITEALGLIDQAMVSGLARALLAGQAGTALGLLDQVIGFGYDTKDFALQVLEFFRALVVVKVADHPEKILDILDADLTELQEIARDRSLETLNFHFNAWIEAPAKLARATQPRLVLEALVVRLAQVEPLRPLAELVARLEALLGSGGPTTPHGGPHPTGSRPGPGPAGETGRVRTRPLAVSTTQTDPPSGAEAKSRQPQRTEVAARTENPPLAASGDQRIKDHPARDRAAPSGPQRRDWPGFLAALKESGPLLAPLLSQGHVREFTPERVTLVFTQKGLINLIDQDELRAALAAFFGGRPALTIEHNEYGAALTPEGQPLRDSLLEHPLIKEAQEIFSGQVLEVIVENTNDQPGPL